MSLGAQHICTRRPKQKDGLLLKRSFFARTFISPIRTVISGVGPPRRFKLATPKTHDVLFRYPSFFFKISSAT